MSKSPSYKSHTDHVCYGCHDNISNHETRQFTSTSIYIPVHPFPDTVTTSISADLRLVLHLSDPVQVRLLLRLHCISHEVILRKTIISCVCVCVCARAYVRVTKQKYPRDHIVYM